jgi:hypothetical protein
MKFHHGDVLEIPHSIECSIAEQTATVGVLTVYVKTLEEDVKSVGYSTGLVEGDDAALAVGKV